MYFYADSPLLSNSSVDINGKKVRWRDIPNNTKLIRLYTSTSDMSGLVSGHIAKRGYRLTLIRLYHQIDRMGGLNPAI
jgi:hypothetical protein